MLLVLEGGRLSGLVVAPTIDGRELLDRYRDQVDALEEQMLASLTQAQISARGRLPSSQM